MFEYSLYKYIAFLISNVSWSLECSWRINKKQCRWMWCIVLTHITKLRRTDKRYKDSLWFMETMEKIISLDRTVITQKLFTGHSARSLMYTHKKAMLDAIACGVCCLFVWWVNNSSKCFNVSISTEQLLWVERSADTKRNLVSWFPAAVKVWSEDVHRFASLCLLLPTLFGKKIVAQARQECRYSTD